jgi:hypothetical protein
MMTSLSLSDYEDTLYCWFLIKWKYLYYLTSLEECCGAQSGSCLFHSSKLNQFRSTFEPFREGTTCEWIETSGELKLSFQLMQKPFKFWRLIVFYIGRWVRVLLVFIIVFLMILCLLGNWLSIFVSINLTQLWGFYFEGNF